MNIYLSLTIVFLLGLVIGFAVRQVWVDVWGGKEAALAFLQEEIESRIEEIKKAHKNAMDTIGTSDYDPDHQYIKYHNVLFVLENIKDLIQSIRKYKGTDSKYFK